MRSLARTAVSAFVLCGLLASSASAVPASPCNNRLFKFLCAKVGVPLDRSGAVPGVVPLSIRRLRAIKGDGKSAVIFLAGGPGQAASPVADIVAQVLEPALATRDLIVFDQRGTGGSQPLDCPAFRHAPADSTLAHVLPLCASQIGAARGHFTTSDSADDIESIRQALGYNRLVLYGTSYGSKVALAYASRYPGNVERLLLDSTVGQNGPDVFGRSALAAVPRVLRALCSTSDCAKITADPVSDLRKLVAELRGRTLVGSVVDEAGHHHRVAVNHDDVLEILLSGDEDPTLRASFPGAVRAALSGDAAPLARLRIDALGAPSTLPGVGPGGENAALYFATTCEELAFPWTRSASASTKLAQLRAAADSLDPALLLPFDSAAALHEGPGADCASWPEATPAAQEFVGALPAVPALIVSGADDLRTPTADAAAVAAQIPGSQLLVVPNAGHSVIGTEPGRCARDGLRTFFSSGAVRACGPARRPGILRPTSTPPLTLAAVDGPRGSGRSARALAAVKLTVQDALRRLLSGFVNAMNSVGSRNVGRTGGLRGGYATLNASGTRLHNYSYVPGIQITGFLRKRRGVLHISGSVSGRLTLRGLRTLAGTLAGRRVHARLFGFSVSGARAAAEHPVWRTP